MKENHQSKEYSTPQFRFVRQDESNKLFFAASGAPVTFVGGSLGSIKKVTGEW